MRADAVAEAAADAADVDVARRPLELARARELVVGDGARVLDPVRPEVLPPPVHGAVPERPAVLVAGAEDGAAAGAVGAAAGVGRPVVAAEDAAALGVAAAREEDGVVVEQARGGVEREAAVGFLEGGPLGGVLIT